MSILTLGSELMAMCLDESECDVNIVSHRELKYSRMLSYLITFKPYFSSRAFSTSGSRQLMN